MKKKSIRKPKTRKLILSYTNSLKEIAKREKEFNKLAAYIQNYSTKIPLPQFILAVLQAYGIKGEL